MVVDADTHVIESEATWSTFGDGAASAERPVLLVAPNGRGGRMHRWMIGGSLVPKPDGLGAARLATPPVPGDADDGSAGPVVWAWRALHDPQGRVDHAAQLGVDVQVVYPTIFLAYLTDDVDLEVALCRSYNRYMADVWAAAGGRLRWVVVPPLHSMEATREEIRHARRHGAVGVFLRGVEGDRSLADPYFEPLYDEADRLGMAICIHTGPGCDPLLRMSDNRYMRNFGMNRTLPLVAFHDLVMSKVPARFPSLRFGFVEAAASWVPFLVHFLGRQGRRPAGAASVDGQFGPSLFEENRFYVACEADEDIPYLSRFTGPGHLMIGSDYAHTDQSAELDIVEKLTKRPEIDDDLRDRILDDNPRAFYGIE